MSEENGFEVQCAHVTNNGTASMTLEVERVLNANHQHCSWTKSATTGHPAQLWKCDHSKFMPGKADLLSYDTEFTKS